MVKAAIGEDEFIRLFKELGPTKMAEKTGIAVRNIFSRRASIEKRYGAKIDPPTETAIFNPEFKREQFPWRKELTITDGVVIAPSDFHYWPGKPSTMHRALVKIAKIEEPQALIANGDVLDFANISRHPDIGWEKKPEAWQEIETAQERLHEISSVLKRGCRRIWVAGNHDLRFETYVALHAPKLAKVVGVHLHDHFPDWETCWNVEINDGDVVVRHRDRGGEYAPKNNTLRSGQTTVTGHLHSAKVMPYTDRHGTRYGVDGGMVADMYHPCFVAYTEGRVLDWRSGFPILRFKGGRLQQPELVLKWDDDHVEYKGKVIRV